MSFSALLNLLYAKSPTLDPTENDLGVTGVKYFEVSTCRQTSEGPTPSKSKLGTYLSCPTIARLRLGNTPSTSPFYLTLKVFSIPHIFPKWSNLPPCMSCYQTHFSPTFITFLSWL